MQAGGMSLNMEGRVEMTMKWAAAVAGVCLLIGQIAPSAAQTVNYPVQNVTLVTHSSPGGGSDVFLRELVKHLTPVMGSTFAVENVRGGSGAKAVAHVAKAPADGSMLYATTPTYIQTTLLSKPEAGYQDLDPIVIVFFDPQLIYTRADAPWKTLEDAIDYAKANPDKGRWGAANPASLERIALERLSRFAGVKVPVVSHEGGADLMINILNGTLDIGVGEMQEIRAQLDAGKIRLLGTLSETRLTDMPNLPTAKEQGYDLVVRKFRGLAGPKNIPDDVARAWHKAMEEVLKSPAYKEQIAKESLIVSLMGRDEARKFTDAFVADVSGSLKELGVVK
jgi:tripartite-type tricarboxylate transporter receptor subunit TctC